WVAGPASPAGERPQVSGAELSFATEAAPAFRWLTYRHWLLDERREEPITDGLAYNSGRGDAGRSPVHDFIVSCEVQALGSVGELVVVLTDGQDEVTAHLSVGMEPCATAVSAVGDSPHGRNGP